MYSIEESLKYWNDEGRYGSIDDRIASGRLWMPYYSYIARQSMDTPYEVNNQAKRTVEFMLKENILSSDYTLLDIGAGMGSYSMEFARSCNSVTALDMNGDCLSVLENRAEQCGLSNIHCIKDSWETYRDNDKFDVTFSAMCPAICNQEELLRLESITGRTACLLTVARGSYEKCRMELIKELALKKPGGMVTEALHYYNVLYLMGRQPCVKCWSEKYTVTASVESLIGRYTVYLKLFGMDENESAPFIQEFFEKKAVNGVVEDECRMNYAMVYWKVPTVK